MNLVQLSFDFVVEWVKNNPKASICTEEGANDFKDIAIFQDYHGLPEFRNVLTTYMFKISQDFEVLFFFDLFDHVF